MDDCFRLGQQSFNNLEFKLSKEWYEKGIEMLRASRPVDRHTQKRIDKITKQQKHRAMLVGGTERERVRERWGKGDF